MLAGTDAPATGKRVDMQSTAVIGHRHSMAVHHNTQADPAKRDKVPKAKASRRRPTKPPQQDPAVTMRIITEQAAFATEIMQRERALAGKTSTTMSSYAPEKTFSPHQKANTFVPTLHSAYDNSGNGLTRPRCQASVASY